MTSAVPSPACPNCGATNVQFVPVRRTSVAEALAAEYFRSVPGSAQNADTIQQGVCGRCGCRWTPRTTEERHLRALSGQLGPEAMRVAKAEEAAAARAKPRQWTTLPKGIPGRTVAIAVIMVIVILLALFT